MSLTSQSPCDGGALADGEDVTPCVPVVKDWRSFTNITESYRHDDNGELVFSCTTFLLLEESDGTVYYGSLQIPKLNISLDQARGCLARVDPDEFYPLLPPELSGLALAPNAVQPGQYVKRPKFLSYRWSAGTKIVAARFLEEARTLNTVRRNPHANIVTFEGCVVYDGRIIGLCLKRYGLTLEKRLDDSQDRESLDKLACFKGIVSGVQHLHSLNMAHNDLNPSNVMLDDDDHPVIVDLGSCKPFGERLTEMGTPKWNDGFDENSTARNDRIGLSKLREWLGVMGEIDEPA